MFSAELRDCQQSIGGGQRDGEDVGHKGAKLRVAWPRGNLMEENRGGEVVERLWSGDGAVVERWWTGCGAVTTTVITIAN